MANAPGGLTRLWKSCTDASNTGGMVWIVLAIVFLTLRYVGLGIAFLAIGLAFLARKRGRVTSD